MSLPRRLEYSSHPLVSVSLNFDGGHRSSEAPPVTSRLRCSNLKFWILNRGMMYENTKNGGESQNRWGLRCYFILITLS